MIWLWNLLAFALGLELQNLKCILPCLCSFPMLTLRPFLHSFLSILTHLFLAVPSPVAGHPFPSCEQSLSLVAVCRLLTAAASLVLYASVVAACGLNSCRSWALEPRLNSWWCPGFIAPGHVGPSPPRDGGVFCVGSVLFTSEPLGKPHPCILNILKCETRILTVLFLL